MQIPEKIKIGIYEYVVKEVDSPIIIDNQLCKGSIAYDDLVINIKNSIPYDKKIQTLWHEIIHGIIRDWGVNINGDDEESKVDWISTGIVQVIKDNPELVSKAGD